MLIFLSFLAALGCALCNGVSAIVQKISVDRSSKSASLGAKYQLRLFKDWPFLLGIILDLLGAVLTFIAVIYLPLFYVEAIIASSIVMTALIEKLYFKRPLNREMYAYIFFMLIGIALLAISASSERTVPVPGLMKWILLTASIPVFLIGVLLGRSNASRASVGLAIVGGIEFSLTAILSRIYQFSHPLWHSIFSAYTIGILLAGLFGINLFSVSLEKSKATVMNAALTSTKILVPTLVGIFLLGDKAKPGFWPLAVTGILMTLVGASLLSLKSKA